MPRLVHLTLTLTEAEATALYVLAGETMGYTDAVNQMFPHPARRAAAYRAYDKLLQARQEAHTKRGG